MALVSSRSWMLVEKLSRGKSHETISQSRKRACPPDSQCAGALSHLLGSTPCLLHRLNPIDCASQGPLPCPRQFCIDPLYKAQAKRNDWCAGGERGVAQCGEPHPTAFGLPGASVSGQRCCLTSCASSAIMHPVLC